MIILPRFSKNNTMRLYKYIITDFVKLYVVCATL